MSEKQTISPILLILLLLASQVQAIQTYAMHHRPEPQHQTSNPQQPHYSFVIYHNMRNFEFETHHHSLHLSAISQTYGINSMGYFFTMNMTVQGIPYSLNIDTGSSDIFIKGQKSIGNPPRKYSCPWCRRRNKKYQISYLDGTLKTYLKEATIEFGKHHFKEHILVAYYAPNTFEKHQGLVGLSFPQLATNPHPNFIQTLMKYKIINRYAFGVNLNFQNNYSSSITFGQPDHSKFEGELQKVPIMSSTSYLIQIDSAQVGNSVHFAVYRALLDTGNSCISFPSQFQPMILEQFNKGQNVCGFCQEPLSPMFWLLRCRVKQFQQLPSVSIFIKSTKFEVNKDAYIHKCVQDDDASLCDTFIESMETHYSKVFIGDGFFNRFYAYFDLQSKEIGLAKNRETLSYKNMYRPYKDFDKDDIAFFNNLKKK